MRVTMTVRSLTGAGSTRVASDGSKKMALNSTIKIIERKAIVIAWASTSPQNGCSMVRRKMPPKKPISAIMPQLMASPPIAMRLAGRRPSRIRRSSIRVRN